MQLPRVALRRLRRRPLLALEASLLLAAIGTLAITNASLESLLRGYEPERVVRNLTRTLIGRLDDQAQSRMLVSWARTGFLPQFPGMCFEAAEGGTSTARVDGGRVFLSSGTRMVRGGRTPVGNLWAPIAFVLDGPTAGSYVLEPGWAVGERAGTREHCSDARERWARVAVAGERLAVEVPKI